MAAPNKKDSLSVKSMNIKEAFQIKSSRKRKASSPKPTDFKTRKINKDYDEDVQIIDIVDLENNGSKLFNSELAKSNSENQKLSSDDVNSSALNSSLNVTVNTTELSEAEEQSESADISSKKSDDCCKIENHSISEKSASIGTTAQPRKKKKMTTQEAKLKAEERDRKQKEMELKKKELAQKKETKRMEKEKRIKEKEELLKQKQLRKEQEERLRQEKKEQEEKDKQLKLKEKEEKMKIKQIMLEQKTEERKKKEEMKQKREEELKKAEEEKLKLKLEKEQKEQEINKKQRAALLKFFIKNKTSATPNTPSQDTAFLPFQVRNGARLAPYVPSVTRAKFDKEALDHHIQLQENMESYLQKIKTSAFRTDMSKTKDKSASEEDVILVDKNETRGLKGKLLQFRENVRPPFWGTWRKRSRIVRPRNPFAQDETVFDYEADSDEEWEDPSGESLSGTENEVESEDDYEVDNEFFVPHGYLSAEEENEDDEVTNDPEKQKALLKIKLQEFENKRKKKTMELKPLVLGCYVANAASKDAGLSQLLEVYTAEFLTEVPVPTSFNLPPSPKEESSPMNEMSRNKRPVPEEAIPFLIKLLHGNMFSRPIVVKEFQEFWHLRCQKDSLENKQNIPPSGEPVSSPRTPSDDSGRISKRQIELTISRISSYGKCPTQVLRKCCWWVKDEMLSKYGLSDLPVPNQWNYVSRKDLDAQSPAAKPSTPSIKDYLKS